MNKKAISSLELAALVQELQFIVKGKVSQIYHQEKKELLLQLHAPGQGKQLLKIIPGKLLCLTDRKKAGSLRPTGFCMQLRKYINNAFIKSIQQKDSERIVVFELEKKEKYYLIVELFSKGNIVLVDGNYKIIATLTWQKWKDRTVKPGEEYLFPESRVNWKTISEPMFKSLVEKSEKKNLATALATELGLGGVYAEDLCLRVGVDKNIVPTDVTAAQAGLLFQGLQEMLVLLENPKGWIYEEQVTPFPLAEEKDERRTKTYNEAINTLNPFQKKSPYEQKIAAIEKTIATQQEAIESLKLKIEENGRKGERVYEEYANLQKLLDIVKELRKTATWEEVKGELTKEKKISSVNLKKKTVMIEL